MTWELYVNGIGFIAQGLFSARLLVQWIKSEKYGRVLSPVIFWQLSLVASFLLIVYGILEQDLPVIAGQLISYYIYIRNLRLKKSWRFLPVSFRIGTLAFPAAAVLWLIFGAKFNFTTIMENNPLSWILLWGGIGQFTFSMRFVYQWYYSEKVQRSVLPLGFWVISLIGSGLICSYAIYETLYPIILGQIFGAFIYARNIQLHFKQQRKKAARLAKSENKEVISE